MERLQIFWNRGWFAKVIVSIVGLLIVCCVIGILVPRRTPVPAASAPSAPTRQPAAQAERPTTAPESTAIPATAGPTDTPAPTSTSAPTRTPEPTAVPTDPPTPTAPPEPVVLKGKGKVVTDPFMPPTEVNRVTFTHTGKRNFAVKIYRKDGDEDLLVNTIGAYEGSVPLIGQDEVFFEIDADGAWTATVTPLGQDDAVAAGLDGSGDTVSDLFWPANEGPVPFSFSHDGKRNFVVYLRCAGGNDLLVNEIGAIQGDVVVRMVKGPCLWEVNADGAWSMKPK